MHCAVITRNFINDAGSEVRRRCGLGGGGGGGGGGANTKMPDMYGVGGCFRDPKHCTTKGGVHILSLITKVV